MNASMKYIRPYGYIDKIFMHLKSTIIAVLMLLVFPDAAFSEKIYVHTDRDVYIAGEELFFRLYLIPENDGSNGSGIAYILLRNDKNINILSYKTEIRENGSWGYLYLPDTLSTGIYTLTSFTNRMKNSGERSFFNKELIIANRFDRELAIFPPKGRDINNQALPASLPDNPTNTISVSTCSNQYDIRQFARLEIDPGLTDSMVFMSVAVVPEKSVPNYLYLPSQEPKTEISRGADMYIREDRRLVISGTIFDSISKKGVPDVKLLFATPGDYPNLMYARTGDEGRFTLDIDRYYDGKDLYIRFYPDNSNSSWILSIEDKTMLNPSLLRHLEPDREIRAYINHSQDVVRVRKIYQISNEIHEEAELTGPSTPPLVYSAPEQVIYPENFETLNDFIEISREIISVLRIRKPDNFFQARMLDTRADYAFFSEDPAVFLDGILVNDINSIIHLGSDDIHRIEVHNYLWVFGDIQFPGILAIFTKNRDLAGMHLPGIINIFSNESFLPRTRLKPLDYSAGKQFNQEKPDFRQLLLWEPDIVITRDEVYQTGFYTSDLTGNYLVIVSGVTQGGEIVSGITGIKVK
jgi:hypothetical protein